MPRKADGQGTIWKDKACNRWRGRLPVGVDGATGKTKRITFSGNTKREVQAQMNEYIAEMETGSVFYAAPKSMKVSEWLETWQKEYLIDVKDSTRSQYETYIRLHILPAIGGLQLSKVMPQTVQKMINGLQAKVSTKTIKNIYGILHKAMDQAQQCGYIRISPCSGCKLPKVEKNTYDTLSSEELAAVLQELQGSEYEPIITFIISTGVRIGEALGLQWDCVNLEKKEVTINKQLQRNRFSAEYELVPTKTSNTRIVALPASAFSMLLKVRQKQWKYQDIFQTDYNGAMNLVFCHEDGGHFVEHTVLRHFKGILDKLGIEKSVCLHGLRHTFATLSLEDGCPLFAVSKALGHATINTTANVYGHQTETMRREIADKMEQHLTAKES